MIHNIALKDTTKSGIGREKIYLPIFLGMITVFLIVLLSEFVCAVGAIDLTLSDTDVSFSNHRPTIGDNVQITATIHNDGNVNAKNVLVIFYRSFSMSFENKEEIGRTVVRLIPAYDKQDVSINYTCDALGENFIRIEIPDYGISQLGSDQKLYVIGKNGYTKMVGRVPYYYQNWEPENDGDNSTTITKWCGPYSLMMAMEWWRKNDENHIQIGDIVDADEPYSKEEYEHAYWMKDIKDKAIQLGFECYWNTYVDAPFRGKLPPEIDDIKAELSKNKPVICCGKGDFNGNTGNEHVVLVVGYDDDNGVFYINDPAREYDIPVSYDDFFASWDAGAPFPMDLTGTPKRGYISIYKEDYRHDYAKSHAIEDDTDYIVVGRNLPRPLNRIGCKSEVDKDFDGNVELFELVDYINLWAQGSVGVSDVLDAIDWWATGESHFYICVPDVIITGAPSKQAIMYGQITATRNVPESAIPGASITVNLEVNVEGFAPNGVIVIEYIPPDWTIPSPPYNAFYNAKEGVIKWCFYGDGVKTQMLTYTVEIPADTEIETAKITGQIFYKSEEQYVTVPIGESHITIQKILLTLKDVLNCPNPFSDRTTFTYVLSVDAEVDIEIYNVAGQLVKEMRDVSGHQGYNEVIWEGKGENGEELANGAYIYRVVATNGEEPVSKISKLAILR
jgi:hypothetical protein